MEGGIDVGEFGRLRVMVECSLSTLITLYGPSYQGMNLATLFLPFALNLLQQCSMDSQTWEPIAKRKFSVCKQSIGCTMNHLSQKAE